MRMSTTLKTLVAVSMLGLVAACTAPMNEQDKALMTEAIAKSKDATAAAGRAEAAAGRSESAAKRSEAAADRAEAAAAKAEAVFQKNMRK